MLRQTLLRDEPSHGFSATDRGSLPSSGRQSVGWCEPMSSSASSNAPRHATHRYHTGLVLGGVFLTGVGVYGMSTAASASLLSGPLTAISSVGAILGATLAVLGMVGRRAGAGVIGVNTSFDLISRGRLSEAEKLLDEVERTDKTPLIRSVSAVQRGLIAMRRGDAKTGLAFLDRGIDTKARILYRSAVRVQTINARGIRAFLRAATGDRQGAREDIDAVRQSPDVLPQSLARAALAEAICIEREGDRDKLRAHLAEHRDLLLDVTDRRERAIVRAYQRMLETTATSVYRKGAKPDTNSEEPPLVDWVAQMVPGAAPFVEMNGVKEKSGDLPAAVATESAKKELENARKTAETATRKGVPLVVKTLLLWAVLIGMFAAIWQLNAPSEASYDDMYDGDAIADAADRFGQAAVGFLGAMLAWIFGRGAWQVMKSRRQGQELFAAMNLSAQGKLAAAKEQFEALTKSQFMLVKAQAYLALAQIAEREADLNKSLEFCDKGLACLSKYVARISAADILLPDLMSQRAFVLAAMDRHDEAEAELASLPPAYPYKSRAMLRVRLVEHSRRGDFAGAAAIAAEAGLDLPLTARDELLADGVRIAFKPESLGAGELPRIRRELRSVVSMRTWLETIAPKTLESIERASDESPVHRDDADRERLAEEEARAEEEAAHALRLPLST